MTEKQERGSIDNWNKTKIFYIVQCRYSLALSYQEEKEHEKEKSDRNYDSRTGSSYAGGLQFSGWSGNYSSIC